MPAGTQGEHRQTVDRPPSTNWHLLGKHSDKTNSPAGETIFSINMAAIKIPLSFSVVQHSVWRKEAY